MQKAVSNERHKSIINERFEHKSCCKTQMKAAHKLITTNQKSHLTLHASKRRLEHEHPKVSSLAEAIAGNLAQASATARARACNQLSGDASKRRLKHEHPKV